MSFRTHDPLPDDAEIVSPDDPSDIPDVPEEPDEDEDELADVEPQDDRQAGADDDSVVGDDED